MILQCLSTLKRTDDLRSAWANEATDFTPWIAEHIDELASVLGLDLEITQKEASVGDFSVDLLAKDLGRDRIVIIENQLNATDHDHLGKLLTYASGLNAQTVVWVAKEIRPEHRQALDWLNQHTDGSLEFFAVTVELVQIDNSPFAPNFQLAASPNEWRKSVIQEISESPLSERASKYKSFFQALIDDLRDNHRFTNARVGQDQSWYAFSSGSGGVKFSAVFTRDHRVRTEVYIDTGDKEKNKSLFDFLLADRVDIESHYDLPLSWERLDDKQASRIAIYRNGSIDDATETLEQIHDFFVKELLRIREVFSPRIKQWIVSNENAPI